MTSRTPPEPFSPPTRWEPPRPADIRNSGMTRGKRVAPKKKRLFTYTFLKVFFSSIAGGVLALTVIAMAMLLVLNPTDMIRDQITAKIKNQFGRDLIISGASSVSFYPSFGVRLHDVSLSGPEDFSGSPFITMQELGIRFKILPLLKREFVVEHLDLANPEIHFEVDKTGLKSWDFQKKRGQDLSPSSASPENHVLEEKKTIIGSGDQRSVPTPLSTAGLENLSFEDIHIKQGAIYYGDAESGTKEKIQDVNLVMGFESLTTPAKLSGQWTWRGETYKVSSKLDTLKNFLAAEPTHLVLQISGRLLSASFDGLLNSKAKGDTAGKLRLEVPSFSALTGLAQSQNASLSATDTCSLTANLSALNNTLTLNATSLDCPFSSGRGDISLSTNKERPYIKARLDFSKLDLTPFLAKTAKTISLEVSPRGVEGRQDIPGKTQNPLERELQSSSPISDTQKGGWSEEAYNYKSFGLADIDASLLLAEGVLKDIKFGKSQVLLSLKNSILETKLSQLELYEGTAKGTLALNATDPRSPEITANLEITNLQLHSFLKDAAQIDWLMGKGAASINLKGKGPTQKALVESLAGSTVLQFHDGAIVGINIAGLFRNGGGGLLSGLKSAPTEKTDLSEFSSRWSISKGIASNIDLQALSPLLRVSGSGNILLADRTFDYILRPKVVADLSGQGGNQALSGFQIPVRIHGPWEKPKFSPDVKGLLEDPNKAVETIKEIGKQFKGKNPAEILNNLFGKGQTSPQTQNTNPPSNSSETPAQTSTAPPPKTSKTEQILKQFLNPQ